MKKKKLKLKTKYKFLLIIIAIFLVTFFSINFLFNIILIGDKDIYLNVNSSYFENGYKATFFGKKLKVDVKNNIDNTSLGDYKVTYTANLLNLKKSVTRNVYVVDNEKPIITLNGDNIIYLNKDSKYEEPGYEITDNYDKDINSKIKVTNNIDETKAGKYEVVYEAIDSSKNKAKVVRAVEVIDDSALTSSIKDFTLKGLFTKTTLTYEENDINYLYSSLKYSNNINVIDTLKNHNKKTNMYYKTDHHWTSFGAYYAYKKYMESKNIIPNDESYYNIVKVSNSFKGTSQTKVLSYDKSDDIYLFLKNENLTINYVNENKITNSLYNYDYLDKKDKYSIFLDNNHALIEIENFENENSILVIKNSYANSFIPFLTSHYKNIYVIDLRYYNKSVSDFVKSKNIDNVLILYNLNNLYDDMSILKLR